MLFKFDPNRRSTSSSRGLARVRGAKSAGEEDRCQCQVEAVGGVDQVELGGGEVLGDDWRMRKNGGGCEDGGDGIISMVMMVKMVIIVMVTHNNDDNNENNVKSDDNENNDR